MIDLNFILQLIDTRHRTGQNSHAAFNYSMDFQLFFLLEYFLLYFKKKTENFHTESRPNLLDNW